jgi:ABC-type transport system involved in multi-copper enzyme maturation permease subunit
MKILALALNTAREAVRNRLLYSIVFFAVIMVGISAVFGSASIGDQMKFIKDFSLMSISLFGVIIAVVLGVNLLHQELTRKTILNTLSKPVARWQFILGKFFGLLITLTIIVSAMCAALTLFLASLEGEFDWGLMVASGAALLEIVIIIAIAIFFSSLVVTPTLAGLFTIACFIAGRSSAYLHYFFSDEHSLMTQSSARVLSWILPRLDMFLLGDRVVYGDLIDSGYLLFLIGYAFAYSAVLLLLAIGLFSRREFK